MGARLVKFEFCPGENEGLETIVKIPEDHRSVIHGIVKNNADMVVKDAVVKLFEITNSSDPYSLKPLTHTFTDDYGQFLFGPLAPNKKYLIKVWYNNIKVRELVIKPEEYDAECDS